MKAIWECQDVQNNYANSCVKIKQQQQQQCTHLKQSVQYVFRTQYWKDSLLPPTNELFPRRGITSRVVWYIWKTLCKVPYYNMCCCASFDSNTGSCSLNSHCSPHLEQYSDSLIITKILSEGKSFNLHWHSQKKIAMILLTYILFQVSALLLFFVFVFICIRICIIVLDILTFQDRFLYLYKTKIYFSQLYVNKMKQQAVPMQALSFWHVQDI
jgi:hypothetical protein